MPADVIAAIDEMAIQCDCSKSDVVRELIISSLRNYAQNMLKALDKDAREFMQKFIEQLDQYHMDSPPALRALYRVAVFPDAGRLIARVEKLAAKRRRKSAD